MWFKMYKNILSLTVKTSKTFHHHTADAAGFFYFAVRNGFFMMIHSHIHRHRTCTKSSHWTILYMIVFCFELEKFFGLYHVNLNNSK